MMRLPDQEIAASRTAPSIEELQLRGISRTVAEIHWLLLILVLVYLTFGDYAREVEPAISAGAFFYAAFVMSFRYAFFFTQESRGKIALETWAMIAFITWTLAFSGGLSSPLLSTYLLPIITSALTLGKVTTLLEVAAVAACHVWLGGNASPAVLASLSFIGATSAQMAPVILVAYIVTLFSTDIQFGLNRARLLAETDDLTGVLNTRGFAIAATRAIGQSVRYERPATLLMIDSDNLKAVNDAHGHETGNRLLCQIARIARTELRLTDVLGRYGGDEFIVLLPETPTKGASIVAERIREMMANTPIEADGKQIKCTISIGAATYPDDGPTLDALVARADRAMYQAKATGRNKVVHFRELRAAKVPESA